MLIDSAHIQENDVKHINKRRLRDERPLVEPLYTIDDAEKVFELLVPVQYDELLKIDEQISVIFSDCGHILGSAAINVRVEEEGITKTLCFSGDVGRYRDMILRAPEVFPQADYIIMESTYGDRLHDESKVSNEAFLKVIVDTCLKGRGKLIVPAFSMARTQELLFILNQLELQGRLPPLNYYVDSPLSIKITETVKKYPDSYNNHVRKLLKDDEDIFAFKGLKYVDKVQDSIALNDSDEPCVIISASGMAEAGRVKHHIANNVGDAKNTILLTGYCEPLSLGGRLKLKPDMVRIFGKEFKVKARIEEITSLSAHGDYEDMCQWLSCQDPALVNKLFLVHGDYEAQEKFRGVAVVAE
jgi:metallo-beta-lactamase family protein